MEFYFCPFGEILRKSYAIQNLQSYFGMLYITMSIYYILLIYTFVFTH